MKLEKDLQTAYSKDWESLGIVMNEINADIQTPFLLSVARGEGDDADESWWTEADIRVMFFGKEVNQWRNEDTDDPLESVEAAMALYKNFYSVHYNYDAQVGHFYTENMTSSFFRDGVNGIMSELGVRFPGKKIACLTNNISKLSTSEGKSVSTGLHDIEMNELRVIVKEVGILKPNILIFFTGPGNNKYFRYIKQHFQVYSNEKLGNVEERDAVRLILNGRILAYKTHHPQGHKNRWEHYNAILDDIMYSNQKRFEQFVECARFCVEEQKVNHSMIQRKFDIPFNEATHIKDQLYEAGIIGPENAGSPRSVLIPDMDSLEQHLARIRDENRIYL